MDLSFFQGEACTILRKTFTSERDELGQQGYDIEEIEAECVVGVSSTSFDGKPFNKIEEVTLALIFDHRTDLRDGDTFNLRGIEWEPLGGVSAPAKNLLSNSIFPPPKKVIVRRIGVNNENI